MSLLDRKYIVTANLDDGTVDAPAEMKFFNTDENIANIYIRLIKKNEDGINTELTYFELDGYTVTLEAVKPKTNQIRRINAKENTDTDINTPLKFELDSEFTNQSGSVKNQLFITNTEGKKLTIDSFKFIINSSIVTDLNDEIESDPERPILLDLIDRVEDNASILSETMQTTMTELTKEVQKVNYIDNVNITDTNTYSNKKIEEKFSTVNAQFQTITNNVSNNRPFKPKIYAYLSQGGSRTQETYGTPESWANDCKSFVRAGITDIALSVQVQPLKSDRDAFIAGQKTASQLQWKTYPTLEKVREMIVVAKQYGLNLYIIKMQDTWIKEQESAGRLSFNDYATAYHNLTMQFANSDLQFEWLTIYNEHWTIINVSNNYETIKNTLVTVKGANRKTGFSGVPDVDDFYTNYIDAWMPHYYPSISWKKQQTTFEDGVYGWLASANHISDTPLEEMRRKRRKYPNKKILITEIGCSHFWEDLLAPAIYSSSGTADEKGMPTAIFLKGFFEVFRNEDFDSVGIYYTNPLREEPIKIIRQELGVV